MFRNDNFFQNKKVALNIRVINCKGTHAIKPEKPVVPLQFMTSTPSGTGGCQRGCFTALSEYLSSKLQVPEHILN